MRLTTCSDLPAPAATPAAEPTSLVNSIEHIERDYPTTTTITFESRNDPESKRTRYRFGLKPTASTAATESPRSAFRGVQNLCNLWNKRIRAIAESHTRPGLAATKATIGRSSVELARPHQRQPGDGDSDSDVGRQRPRAQSLKDCSLLGQSEADQVLNEAAIDFFLHREKDNFYKYKTAEQAARHLTREARMRSKRRSTTSSLPADPPCPDRSPEVHPERPKRESASSSVCTSSRRSSTDLSSNGGSGRVSARRTLSGAARKYSFKTHAHAHAHAHAKSYLSPRKLHAAKECASGEGGGMVAKLTQQFNEIIQKDRTLLEEVKRKNGILMSRGGHVYKVVENTELGRSAGQRRTKDHSPRSSTVQRAIKKFEKPPAGHDHTPPQSQSHSHSQTQIQIQPKKPEATARSIHAARTASELPAKQAKAGESTKSAEPQTLFSELQSKLERRKHILTPLAAVTEEFKAQPAATEQAPVPHSENSPNGTEAPPTPIPTSPPTTTAREQPAVEAEGPATPPPASSGETAEKSKPKNKYAKIYEKLRFRSPFRAASKKPPAEAPTESPPPVLPKARIAIPDAPMAPESSPKHAANLDPQPDLDFDAGAAEGAQSECMPGPEAKILDALEVIDQKLRDLTQAEVLRTGIDDNATSGFMLAQNDDFEQRVLPNSSFVYQATGRQVCNDQLLVTQAVNVALVNGIGSGQLRTSEADGSRGEKLLDSVESQADDKEEAYETITLAPLPLAATASASVTAPAPPIAPAAVPSPGPAEPPASADEIYQTVGEAHAAPTPPPLEDDHESHKGAAETETETSVEIRASSPRPSQVDSLDHYESIAGSCEHAPPAPVPGPPTADPFDGYDLCAPPADSDAATAPATAATAFATPVPTSPPARNTNDELPELPKPKRRLPKSPMPGKRPPKPAAIAKCDNSAVSATAVSSTISALELLLDDDQHYYADDENIYDTIKGSHCYESLRKATVKSCDSVSLTSNGYESITHYRRIAVAHMHGGVPHVAGSTGSGGSTLTISSDQKTNSLYEMSLTAGVLAGYASHCGVGRGSRQASIVCDTRSNSSTGSSAAGELAMRATITTATTRIVATSGVVDHAEEQQEQLQHYSNVASSDNSDEWIDISDSEGDAQKAALAKQPFIVVRERTKVHRSPDWTKRVRDKRMHQQDMHMSCTEDDSDHYYETMSPLGNKRHSTQLANSHLGLNHTVDGIIGGNKQQSASTHALTVDDYDSFDTDDDLYGGEERDDLTRPHDSGVELNHSRLPDPPAPTNQVYAIVRKFKNFISNKKSPGSTQKSASTQKLYVNSSFYVERQVASVEQPILMPKTLPKMAPHKASSTTPSRDDYENTEFHAKATAPATATAMTTATELKQLSVSERNLSTPSPIGDTMEPSTLRTKCKSGKSFKSRLRKSLGSSFETKLSIHPPTPMAQSQQQLRNSTFYIASTYSLGGDLDSGFSEKNSSGDLGSPHTPIATPTATPTPTPTPTSTPTPAQTPTPVATPSISATGTPHLPEMPKFLTLARKCKKESKAANAQRRRTTIGVRPIEPPPPPPPITGDARHQPSSWYAECGVFKSANGGGGGSAGSGIGGIGGICGDGGELSRSRSQNGSMSSHPISWYAEAGLYQTSGISVTSASSSGSSGVSTGNEAGLGDDLPHSLFQNEPLYQIYSATKLQSLTNDMEDDSTDGYEEIGRTLAIDEQHRPPGGEHARKHSRPTALQLVEPKNGPSRTLWSEIPEVLNSCILPTLSARERCLQEAKFEIITSEASYLKSLNLLRTHFMNYQPFRDVKVLSARDRKTLFAQIIPVHECSERLLSELESCWQDNIMLQGLSRRIYAIAEKHFHVYIAFCEHQGRMDRTLRRLKEARSSFARSLDTLEASPQCCGLNLHSFLMLPMQRITRLPLLIDAVFSKVDPNDDEYDSWKMTLAIMNKIVTQCNDAANRCEQAYEIERISRQLEFPTTIRALAIAPVGVAAPGAKPRFLVKKGELTHLIWRGDDAKLTFGKKFIKTSIYAFLFSDLLVLTKRKSDEHFVVFDYCPRNLLTLSPGDQLPQLPTKDLLNQAGKNLILMTLLENHERKTVELVVSCPSVSEQERWLHAMRPPEAETPGEKLYEQWDCPQVIAKHAYDTKEPDALSLEVGDVINVMRKLPDGWYHGERIRDGASGWFPGSYTEEVNSAHVRARNLKQRYRLLTFTATYLEAQKRK